jgi:hypothetical protein
MIPELRARGIGEILDAAVALYRARFGRLLRVAAFVVVPVQILNTIVLLSAQPDGFNVSYTGQATPRYDENSALVGLSATLVVLAVNFIASAFIVAACTRVVADAYVAPGQEAREAARQGRRRVFAVMGTSFMVLMCEGGALFAGVFVGVLIVLATTPYVGLVLGIAAVFVPLSLFAVAIPSLILESTGVFRALGRSVTLTKSKFFHVLGLVVTAQLLGSVLNVGIAEAVSWFVRHGGSTTAAVIGQAFANTIASVLTTPFLATAAVALYFDVRIRKEGFDVQLLMQRTAALAPAAL